MTIDQFTKTSSPITVIVNVANPVAIKLAHILIEQGSRLLIVDKLNSDKKRLIADLLTNEKCLFMDAESTFRNIEKFKKFDYVYYFLSQTVAGSTYPAVFPESMETVQLTHKEFLKESNRVDAYVKLAVEFDASFTLVTSAYVSQFLEPIPEANLQVQKYAESLVLDYVERNRLNGRIVRIGELIGKEGDFASPTNLSRLIREVILRNNINIFGDGLQQNFLVHTEDAVYAILKAAFSKEAKGRTYMAVYPHPFTSLSIAYQLLELSPAEKQVVFNEVLPSHDSIAKLKDLCLAPSATGLGWDPQIPLDQALAESVQTLAEQLKHPWTPIRKATQPEIEQEVGTREDDDLAKDAKVAKVTKAKVIKAPFSPFKAVGGALHSVYVALIARPILAISNAPKVFTARYARSAAKLQETVVKTLLVVVISLGLTVLTYPYLHFGVSGFKLYRVFSQVKQDAAAFKGENFVSHSEKILEYTEGMAEDYKQVSYLQEVPTMGAWYLEGIGVMNALQSYGRSAATSLQAAAPVLKMVQGFASISPNNPAGTVTRDYYTEIEQVMAQKQAFSKGVQEARVGALQLKAIDETTFPSFLRPTFEEGKALLLAYTESVDQLGEVYDLIPYLLGYKDRRTYFLMIQNETEIRATGGWMTGYVIVGIENGQVRQFTVNDVYDIDGKITGLPFPQDMKLGLKPAGLQKLSLSNWNPELKETAKTVTELFSQAGVYKPNDVTVSLTFQVAKDILEITGPITIENLGEINADNVYEKVVILHGQFTPGSQEKTKSVSAFLPKLLDKIIESSASQKQQILTALFGAVKQRSIMVYGDNQLLQEKLLTKYDTYRTVQPKNSPVFAVDWNWGGNKANKYTKRVTDIEINEQQKVASIALSYTNESKLDEYPQGKYVNVQRLYYPVEFTFSQAIGYSAKPQLYKSTASVPYLLGEFTVEKQETKSVQAAFTFTQLPKFISIYKQSGIDVEIVRVTITRADNSAIDKNELEAQGFSEMSGKWFKTYVRKEDLKVVFSK
jgi:nucleoside-diphosphate-sugar epimerase